MDRKFALLEIATDPVQMAPRLQARLFNSWNGRPQIQHLHVSRVFPSGDGSLSIQYVVYLQEPATSTPRRMIFCGQWFGMADGRPTYLAEEPNRVVSIDDLDLAVPIFPFDPDLRIAPLLDDGRVLRSQASLSNIETDYRWSEFDLETYEVLSYRLRRRCVLRLKTGPSRSGLDMLEVIAKIYRPTKFHRVLTTLNWLETRGYGRVAEDSLAFATAVAVDRERGYLFLKPSVGKSVHDSIGNGSFVPGCAAAAGILSKLHSESGSDLPRHDWKSETKNLSPTMELAGSIYPEMSELFRSAFDALQSRAVLVEASRPTAIHRDFYDKQVLFGKGAPTTLLDFDSLASGDRACDVGNFLAHLDLRELQHPEAAAEIRAGESAFLGAYDNTDDDIAPRVRWWRAASLLRLGAIYALRPRWRHLAATLAEKSRQLISIRERMKGKVVQ
ncbi:MAG: phosphotransferase [Candidatus Zixiibacteriota bacterium]